MRVVSILAVAALLAACEPAAAPEAADDTAAAEAEAASDETAPDAGSDPEAFVRNLYGAMASGELAPMGEEGEVLWSRAAWADVERVQSIEGGLGYDPVCACQDPADLVIQRLDITETGTDRADAAVELVQGEAQSSLTLNLVREDGAWRIDDITREGDPNLRAELADFTG